MQLSLKYTVIYYSVHSTWLQCFRSSRLSLGVAGKVPINGIETEYEAAGQVESGRGQLAKQEGCFP